MNHLRSLRSLKNSKIHVMLPGSAGLLEGWLTLSEKTNAPLALILHPHPKHNGTMNNKIVNLLYKNFETLGFNTLKINFRGVGHSQGEQDGSGESEIDDALTALDWLMKKYEKKETSQKNTRKLWIAGYSFGAWIALQCAMRRPEVSGFVAVGTPFNNYSFNMLTPCPNGMIVHATNDHIISSKNAQQFSEQLITQKGCQIVFEEINTNHYFTDNTATLYDLNHNYIKKFVTTE